MTAETGSQTPQKYVRYRHQGRISYGILDGETVREIRGGLFGDRNETGASAALNAVQILWPCEPSKIMAVGLNYRSHIPNRPIPKNPEFFFVPTSALLEPGGRIVLPADSKQVHYEGELVIVIGRVTRRVTASEANECIFGFTCGHDVSERDWQKNDLQWWRAKGCDTFSPMGPAIATGFDWRRGRVETHVNGAVVQSGNFTELIYDPPALVSFASQYLTLLPGDVLYTGTPGSTSELHPGDLVEVEIPGIGILRNTVSASEAD